MASAASKMTPIDDSMWARTGFRVLLVFGFGGLAAFCFAFFWQGLLTTQRPVLADFEAERHLDRFVSVKCDSINLAFQIGNDKKSENAFACEIGDRILPIVSGKDWLGREVEGKLRSTRDGRFTPQMVSAPEILPVYVVVTPKVTARLLAMFSILCAIASLTFAVLAIRGRNRERLGA